VEVSIHVSKVKKIINERIEMLFEDTCLNTDN
jgi:hypothetical protein